MAEFEIHDEELAGLNGKVVVVTGCASGIGLATVELLLSLGAKIVAGDLNEPPITDANFIFQRTDVTSWSDLTSLFTLAHSSYNGRIDHVFANAGIAGRADYLSLETNTSGELVEPSFLTYDINLRGMLNTSILGFHYMQKQQPAGGSVVVTASASSFQRFCVVDYATAKHGVLGFMRGMVAALELAKLPIRVNAISPSWTVTGLVPEGLMEAVGRASQPAEVVARSVAILMANDNRNGHLLYSEVGKYKEIDEAVLLKATTQIVGDELDDNTVMARILAIVEQQGNEQEAGVSTK